MGGVEEMLLEKQESPDLPSLPAYWVIKLNQDDWPDRCEIALFNAKEFWLEPLIGENLDLSAATAGSQLAVIRDRTVGMGKDRTLNWEVTVVDPEIDEIRAELTREEATPLLQKKLTSELS